jgi:hypothetical protein
MVLYESSIHCMGPHGSLNCMGGVGSIREPDVAIMEADGAIWEPHAPYGNHMCHMEAIWELCAPGGWELHVLYRSMGAI